MVFEGRFHVIPNRFPQPQQLVINRPQFLLRSRALLLHIYRGRIQIRLWAILLGALPIYAFGNPPRAVSSSGCVSSSAMRAKPYPPSALLSSPAQSIPPVTFRPSLSTL